mmetsp:Transcript_72027/g.187820  ORF Transcript_72027/g.187820 Transcript_72027/m.187820 type:complete len:99 (-) Transcript_72027:714-1010(-)
MQAGSPLGPTGGYVSLERGLLVGMITGARMILSAVQFAFGAPQTPLQQTASGAQQMLPQHVAPLSQTMAFEQQTEPGAPAMPLQHVEFLGTGRAPQYL